MVLPAAGDLYAALVAGHAAAVLRREGSGAAEQAPVEGLVGLHHALAPHGVLPVVAEVIDVATDAPLVEALRQRHRGGVRHAQVVPLLIRQPGDARPGRGGELEQVVVLPPARVLDRAVQVREGRVGGEQEAPPRGRMYVSVTVMS